MFDDDWAKNALLMVDYVCTRGETKLLLEEMNMDYVEGSWWNAEKPEARCCSVCGEKISENRLKILPRTTTCVRHSREIANRYLRAGNIVALPKRELEKAAK